MIRIELPYPPSTNNLFSNGKKGRFKSAAYKAWLQLAAINIKDSHRQNLGPYSIAICLKRPDMRRRDIGNFEKAVSDLLVAHGVVKDDSLCQRLSMQWNNNIPSDCVVLVQSYEGGIE